VISLVPLALLAALPLNDIRPESIRDGITEASRQRARALIDAVEVAYGRDRWREVTSAEMVMSADWRTPVRSWVSGWKINPQRFHLRATPTEEALTFLNGPREGEVCVVRSGKLRCGGRDVEDALLTWKIVVKSYWLQFPFRIGEASVVASAGPETIEGVTYERVFGTWKDAAPQRDVDQFVLYVHPKSHRIEWLHFTVRDKAAPMATTIRWTGFETYDGILQPQVQTVWLGSPTRRGPLMHENTIELASFR